MAVPEMIPERQRMTDEALESLTLLFEDKKLSAHLNEVIRDFRGNFDILESALGALIIGRVVGWRVLKLLHSARAFRRYEKILGLEFQGKFPWSLDEDVMPERGPYRNKSVAFKVTEKLGNFWEVANAGRDVPKKEADLL
jgi:hypothetical protein